MRPQRPTTNSQWREFSCLRWLSTERDLLPLANDLRALQAYIAELSVRIAKIDGIGDPIGTDPGGNPTGSLAKHAHQHATFSANNFAANAGADLITPYTMEWFRDHTWSPGTDLTPITINLIDGQTANALHIANSDGETVFVVDNANAVGINESDPTAHLVVQATGFDPLTLTPYMWYKADSLVLADGAAVTTWSDSSGNSYHLSAPRASSTITYENSLLTINSKPAVLFDRTSSQVPFFGTIASSPHILSTFTMYVVWVRQSGASSSGEVALFNASSADFITVPSNHTATTGAQNSWRLESSTNPGFDTNSPNVYTDATDAGNPHVLTMIKAGQTIGAIEFFKDGTSIGTASGNDYTDSHWTQFYSYDGQTYTGGYVAEVLVFTAAHNPTQRAQVEAYLNAKYNLNGGGSGGAALDMTYWQDTSGNVKATMDSNFYLGLNVDPSVRLHVLDTTEQLRLSYSTSGSTDCGFTVSSGGDLTITPDGGDTTITGTLTVSTSFSSGGAKFTVSSAGDLTKVNNVAYTWPASQGAADRYLRNDGAGALTWAQVSLTAGVIGTLPATNGGTGQSTVATGDLLYGSATDTWSRRAIGATSDILQVVAGVPAWVAPATAIAHTILSATHTDTTADTVVRGDLITGQGASPKWARLAKGTTGKIIRANATDAVYSTFTIADVYSQGDIVHATTSNTLSSLGIGTSAQILMAVSGLPVWRTVSTDATINTAGTLTIANNAITDAKLRDSGALSVIGRAANSSGDPADISATAAGNTVLIETGSTLSWAKVNLTTHITGTLPITNGGTNGTATPTNGGVAYGTGTAFSFSAAGTTGQILRSAGAAAPTWSTATYPATAGTSGNILQSDGTNFTSVSLATAGVQPLDADLTEIAAIANVRGDLLLTNSGPTWVRLPIGASGTVLRSDGTDAAWASLATAGIVGGTGTINQVAKWTSTTAIGNGLMSDDGTDAFIGVGHRLGVGIAAFSGVGTNYPYEALVMAKPTDMAVGIYNTDTTPDPAHNAALVLGFPQGEDLTGLRPTFALVANLPDYNDAYTATFKMFWVGLDNTGLGVVANGPLFTMNSTGVFSTISGNVLDDGAGGFVAMGAAQLNAGLNVNGFQINGVATPSISTDAATKGYVDTVLSASFAQISDKNINTTTTETTLLDAAGPNFGSNILDVGYTIKIRLWGYYSCLTVTPGTLNLKVKLAGATICTTGAQNLPTVLGGANRQWRIECDIVCRSTGSSGTVMAQGTFLHMETAGVVGAPTWWEMLNTATSTVNTTTTLGLDVTAQFSASSASNKIICTNAIVELVPG